MIYYFLWFDKTETPFSFKPTLHPIRHTKHDMDTIMRLRLLSMHEPAVCRNTTAIFKACPDRSAEA